MNFFDLFPPYFQIMKSYVAAELDDVFVKPASNIVNQWQRMTSFFKTAKTGTIKTIEMNFGGNFSVFYATVPNGTYLHYLIQKLPTHVVSP